MESYVEKTLNLWAIAFPDACKEIILSLKMEEKIKIAKDNDKGSVTGIDRTICYYHFSSEKIDFDIMLKAPKDHYFLTFVRWCL